MWHFDLKTKYITSVFQQINLRTDDKKLNEKRMKENLHLKELSKEKTQLEED